MPLGTDHDRLAFTFFEEYLIESIDNDAPIQLVLTEKGEEACHIPSS